MDINFWSAELKLQEDKAFTQYILSGLTKGFRLGFHQPPQGLQAAKRNLLSASEHPQEVTEYITKELALNRLALAGTEELREQLGIHISPLGVIPKKHKENQWRLIMDLSSPPGRSVNDGISKELCSFHYTSVDEAAKKMVLLPGEGRTPSKNGHKASVP